MQQAQTDPPGLAAIHQLLAEAKRRKLTEEDANRMESELIQCCAAFPGGCRHKAGCIGQHELLTGLLPAPNTQQCSSTVNDTQRYSDWMPTFSLRQIGSTRREYDANYS